MWPNQHMYILHSICMHAVCTARLCNILYLYRVTVHSVYMYSVQNSVLLYSLMPAYDTLKTCVHLKTEARVTRTWWPICLSDYIHFCCIVGWFCVHSIDCLGPYLWCCQYESMSTAVETIVFIRFISAVLWTIPLLFQMSLHLLTIFAILISLFLRC